MQRTVKRGTTDTPDLLFHVFVSDSAQTDGRGKGGLAHSDFACRKIRTGETLSGAITPETITTLGTYQAPTANTNIRIKEVDGANALGIYEVHIHVDWVNATNTCRALTIFLSASGAAVLPIQIPLGAFSEQSEIGTIAETVTAVEGSQLGTDAAAAAASAASADAGVAALENVSIGQIEASQVGTDAAAAVLAIAALNDPAAADIVTAIFANVVDGLTVENICKILIAVLAGKTDNFGTADPKHFRDPADAKNRVTVTTDANGNRGTISFDFT